MEKTLSILSRDFLKKITRLIIGSNRIRYKRRITDSAESINIIFYLIFIGKSVALNSSMIG